MLSRTCEWSSKCQTVKIWSMPYLCEDYSASTKRFLRNLGKAIKEIRSRKGLSQSQLAEKADLDTKYIGAIEGNSARLPNPSIALLRDIAEAMGMSVGEMLLKVEPRKSGRS